MPKLHELLAVESDLKNQFDKILQETIVTFTKKQDHFMGVHKTLKMIDDNRAHEEEAATQYKELDDTVDGKLDYTWKYVSKYINAIHQKESTNQTAKADLVVEGKVLAKDLPATLLLSMESKLKFLRGVYEKIPTLQPGVKWVPDPQRGKGVFQAEPPEMTHKTEKDLKSKTLFEGNKEHPPQIEKWMESFVVGTYTKDMWSGMYSPAKKSEVLGRLDTLIQSIKKARMRANDTEVLKTEVNLAGELYSYLTK